MTHFLVNKLYFDSDHPVISGFSDRVETFHVYVLALGVVVPNLVQEKLLDGIKHFGPVEEDCRNADVSSQGQAHGGAEQGGQLE